MSIGTERVSCEVDANGVAAVRLNRPGKMNALDRRMFDGLVATARALVDAPDVRAVVLSGNGAAFCAGLDFEMFRDMGQGRGLDLFENPAVPIGPAKALGQQATFVWSTVPVPVIAAVHGAAFGGGLQITLGADIRIAAPDAQFSVMEVKWGLIPDMAGTQLLPQLVGRDIAKELTFTGRIVDGEEAVRIGLATRTAADPVAAAMELATTIAEQSPAAVRHAKQLLDMAGQVDLGSGLAAEQIAIRELVGTPEQRAAVNRGLRAAGK